MGVKKKIVYLTSVEVLIGFNDMSFLQLCDESLLSQLIIILTVGCHLFYLNGSSLHKEKYFVFILLLPECVCPYAQLSAKWSFPHWEIVYFIN